MPTSLADGLLWYGVFVFSTVCHEAAHAWTALKLGDDTAYRGGQVSLNPLPHIRREILGMVVMPILTWLAGGWIMGWASAPYNAEWARSFPKRAGLMAAAGPAANLALALLAALLIRCGVEWHLFDAPFSLNMARVTVATTSGPLDFAAELLSILFSLNLLLFAFNLVPVPPLDGSSLPLLLLPDKAAAGYFKALHSPALRFIGLIFVIRGFGEFFPPILRGAANLLYPHAHYHSL